MQNLPVLSPGPSVKNWKSLAVVFVPSAAPSAVLVEASKAPSGMLPIGCTLTSSGCGCSRMELLEPKIVTVRERIKSVSIRALDAY